MSDKNLQLIKEQMQFLSGIKKDSPVKPAGINNSKLLKYTNGADGRIYGIVQESSKYFIKVASKKENNQYNPSDFAYIGGLQNILKERYDSYSRVLSSFNYKLTTLNESFGNVKNIDEDEIPTNAEIDAEKEEKVDSEPISDIETTPEETSSTEELPNEETPSEDNADLDVNTEVPSEETSSTDELPSEEVMDDTTDKPEETSSEGDSQESIVDEIQSLLGKLTHQFGELDNVSPELAKSTINTAITMSKSGIESMDEKEKEDLKDRIDKGGEKIDEEEVNELDESIKKKLDKLIIETVEKYKKSLK